jgi:spermidine synthase
MSRRVEELDGQDTPMGVITLRRRVEPTLGVDVYEVKLGDEYLMSSLFTAAEVALARLALAEVSASVVDVLVGGLGLGYTAAAALDDDRVRSLTVVDALPQVLDWHRRELLPDTRGLATDPRTRLLLGDFFALVAAGVGVGERTPERFGAVLLDIDHTPRHVLHPSHAPFYTDARLRALRRLLLPDGVFGLWSDDPPDETFLAVLSGVFAHAAARVVRFPNPLTGGEGTNTVYLARGDAG